MANIQEILNKILGSRYGRDVRQAIHDGIQQCYYDGKAGEIDLQARQDIDAIEATRNLHTYTHVSQIGLTDPQTVKEIIDALPSKSEIVFGVGAGSVLSNDTPLAGKPCEIRMSKTTTSGGGRGIVEVKRHNGRGIYSNNYYNGALIGWERHVLGNDLANYLPLSGGELTGSLTVTGDITDGSGNKLSERNLETYTQLTQLGMSGDNTIDEIMAALPINSTLQQGIAKTESIFTKSLPFTFAGVLILTKFNHNQRGKAKIYNSETNEIHTCNYWNGVFGDWEKIDSDMGGVVLWQTSDLSVEFAGQTITLSDDISNYSYYEIEYCRASSTSTNRSLRFKTGKIITSSRTRLSIADAYNHFRQISVPSGTSMEISDSNYFTTYGTVDTAVDNTWLIPVRVIGYKKL